ncbi:MAG: response regulator [Candidatus Cloacimonetes bacterium]|nr:response regulator [Candidatus Cloacimonadota bacterium]
MNKKRILVVDDDQDMQVYIETILGSDEVEIISAYNGEEGVNKARSLHPDIIILDVQMPVKDGFATYKELVADEQTSKIPVIMLTAIEAMRGMHFSKEEMGKFYGKEPAHYLDKPIDADKLKEMIREYL